MSIVLRGVFEANERGFGFLRPDDDTDDIFIPPMSINGAFDGDKVEVRVTSSGNGNRGPEGVVTKILERNNKIIVGKFEKSKNFGFVVPENKKIGQDIFIPKANFNGAKNGDIVCVKIEKWPDRRRSAEGKIVDILGKSGKPGVDILSIMYEYD